MCGVAVSRLGITPRDFYDLTPVELRYALEDEQEVYESRLKPTLEVIRLQTLILRNVHYERKDQISDPKRLFPFPWDKPDGPMDIDKMKSVLRGLAGEVRVRSDAKQAEIERSFKQWREKM